MSANILSDAELKSAAEKFGTPCYIFDADALKARLRELREIIPKEIKLCFSIKANPFLITEAAEETDFLEVCSPGELMICERLGADPDSVILSGVNKTEEDIAHALDFGVNIFTAESVLHAQRISRAAAERGKKVPLLLRLAAGSQFGMSEEDAIAIIERRGDYPGVDIEGIHYFVGTQRKSAKQKTAELEYLRGFFRKVRDEYGLELKKLEYGPGFPVPYFEGDDFSDTLAPARELRGALADAAGWADVTIEMGRFITAECGYYLTTADDIKSNGNKNYCITDGGINHVSYFGQIMGMKCPVIRHIKGTASDTEDNKDGKKWCVCGSLCTTGDVLVRDIMFSGLERGDLLVFMNTGAYSVTEAMCLFLSRMMPRVILRKNGGYKLIRDRYDSGLLNTCGMM